MAAAYIFWPLIGASRSLWSGHCAASTTRPAARAAGRRADLMEFYWQSQCIDISIVPIYRYYRSAAAPAPQGPRVDGGADDRALDPRGGVHRGGEQRLHLGAELGIRDAEPVEDRAAFI